MLINLSKNQKEKRQVIKMKEYIIKEIQSEKDITNVNKAMIDIYNWGGEYRPNAYAYLGYIKNDGFVLRLEAEEKNPRATFTEPDQMVCQDSCLEFFADFAPEKDKGYLNFEVNPNGALHLYIGKSVLIRESVLKMGIKRPEGSAFKTEKSWGFEIKIPFAFLKECYGDVDFKTGYKFKGSFYKCGDKTEFPHYGSFTEIDEEKPKFHCPEFFANLIME